MPNFLNMRLFISLNYRAIVFWLIVLLVPFGSIAQNSELSKIDKKNFKTGKKYSKKGQDNEALNYFLEVYSSAPLNVDNLYFITVTYNDRLEDYTNAYKYGNILLSVLNNELAQLNPREDKKRYEKAKDLIDEIELLVLVAKPKVNNDADIDYNDTIIISTEIIETEQIPEETLAKESKTEEDNTQNKQDYNPKESVNISNDFLITPMLGFSSYNLVENNGKDKITETVNREYEREKNNQTLEKDYDDVLKLNLNWQSKFETYNANYLNNLKKSEYDLLQAIYEYNVSIFEKDSIEQIITNLYKRNSLLSEEIASLNWYLDQIQGCEGSDQDSSRSEEYFDVHKSTIIGRYLIERSLSDNDSKRIINEIKGSLIDNTDFSNPKIISIVAFINSYNDNKYLYLVTTVIDDIIVHSRNEYNREDKNLEIFKYHSSKFENIVTYENYSFNELGLKENEISLINGISQTIKRKPNDSSIDTNYIAPIEILQYNSEQRLYFLSDKLEENHIIIDSLTKTMNDSLELQQNNFIDQKENYNSRISEYKTYVNYLLVEKEVDSKSPREQYRDMVDEIVDLAYGNIDYSLIILNRVITFMDTSLRTVQVKFVQDTISLKPCFNQYKVLEVVKLNIGNSDDTYFAIDIGFEIAYDFPENISTNETDSYDATQAFDPNQNKSKNTDQSGYIPSTSGSFKVLSIEGVSILKDRNNKQWKVLEDNPSSYTSYMMFQEEEGWRLPTYNELRSIISYLASSKNNLDQLGWPSNGVAYLSSDKHFDNRNNEIYKAIKFNGTSYQDQDVEGGDEVYLILISE